MCEFGEFDWSTGRAKAHLEMARCGDQDQLRSLAASYDWAQHPEAVLGWIMAQRCIDLATAVKVFMNGDPERFNYLRKREVPDEFRGTARLLDNICLRLNCGFYRHSGDTALTGHKRVSKWVKYQQADRQDGRGGRWILDEKFLGNLLENQPQVASAPSKLSKPAKPTPRAGWLRFLDPVRLSAR